MSAVTQAPNHSERFPKATRSVTKVLVAAYDALNQAGIIDAIYAVAPKLKVSENVMAEAFATLCRSAKTLTQSRRMSVADFEDNFPDHIRGLFIEACNICEDKTAQGDLL